jgi:ribosomal subunit interface protein
MKLRISGKQFEIGQVLPEKVRARLQSVVGKHFDGGAESNVVFSHEGTSFRADCTTHLDSGIVLKAEGTAGDAYQAFDLAVDKLEKQVRRYKRRLRNHHERAKAPGSEQN